jgi:hypothetical protein
MTDQENGSESMDVAENVGMQIERGKGNEYWFGAVVGLSTKGLDPGRDTSHVADSELIHMYGERKHNKGYCFDTARSSKVRQRARELYMLVYQEDRLPHDSYIRESFARVIISEICHKHRMNWTRYAENTWNRRKTTFDRGCPVQYYKTAKEASTFDSVMKVRLAAEIEEDENDLKNTVKEHKHAVHELCVLEDARHSGSTDADIELRARIQREVLELQRSLEHGKCDLSFSHRYLEMYEGGPSNPEMVTHYRNEIADGEVAIKEVEVQLQEALCRLDMVDEPYNLAKRREGELRLAVQTKRNNQEKSRQSKEGLIRKLKINSFIKWELRPSRVISDFDRAEGRLKIEIGKCAFCKTTFPN